MKRHAVIVAAGRGSRVGGNTPKQLQRLGGRYVLDWSVSAFKQAGFDSILIVCPPSKDDEYSDLFPDAQMVVSGGETRAASVRNGLQKLQTEGAASDDAVFIHDAARPGLSQSMIARLTSALDDADGAAPALNLVDAVKHQFSSGELKTVDRTGLHRVQTPQVFRFEVLKKVADALDDYVDDLEAVESSGARIALVDGEERLSKLTVAEDFDRLERLLMPIALPRIGTGFDVHAFEAGSEVTLCGVSVPHDQTLLGHSDADVGWHALTDAILGALGDGDIGDHFPPSDPEWKGAQSRVFLQHAVMLAREAGYQIGNCDLTLICEAPKVKTHRAAMKAATADVLGIDTSQVSIKATTTEQLGFTGRREGIAAQAAVLLSPIAEAD